MATQSDINEPLYSLLTDNDVVHLLRGTVVEFKMLITNFQDHLLAYVNANYILLGLNKNHGFK